MELPNLPTLQVLQTKAPPNSAFRKVAAPEGSAIHPHRDHDRLLEMVTSFHRRTKVRGEHRFTGGATPLG